MIQISGRALAQSSELPVQYLPLWHSEDRHYYITLWVGNQHVGFHVGERSGNLLRFISKADAQRFCRLRNWEEKARVRRLGLNGKL